MQEVHAGGLGADAAHWNPSLGEEQGEGKVTDKPTRVNDREQKICCQTLSQEERCAWLRG